MGAIATLDTIAAGLLRDGEESAVEFGVYDERLTTTDTLQTVWREQGLVHEPGDAPVVQIVQMTLVPVASGVMQDLLLLVVTVPAERRDDAVALAEHVRLTMDIDG
ncbi:MAG: hypothetical protein Q7T55_16250 [Solirubrobacteraceae bacterium]|nr:hypothetical protein [Solirubrobacteraceae bacterium]